MRYYEGIQGHHNIILTRDETNRLFDQFDPTDDNLPSYLHHRGHRPIKQEPYDWLVAHVGEPYMGWRVGEASSQNEKMFLFDDKEKAMLFKLTYGGVI